MHGPINLIVKANGQPSEVERAYDAALHRVDGLLQGLVDELEEMVRAKVEAKRLKSENIIATG